MSRFCHAASTPCLFVPISAERSSWGDYETGSVRVCVCVSVRPSGLKMLKFASSLSFLGRFWFCLFYLIGHGAGFKTSTQNFDKLIMQIYANLFKINEKCYFSVISWPILILFVLSDRAWCGLQNFYTEFLKFINYANLCKFIQNQSKMLLLCHFLADFDSVLFYLIGLGAGFYTEFWNSLSMQIYANLFKINEKCTSDLHFRRGRILRIA